MQIQIEQTKAGLEGIGVETEYLRWWDDKQNGNVLHHFGRYPADFIRQAQEKGMKVVMAELLTGPGSRSPGRIRIQKIVQRIMARTFPRGQVAAYSWDSYQLADALVALTKWEATLMGELYGAPASKTHVVPNGVEEAFLNSKPATRGKWLICTATITERKRVLELVEAAARAQTPLWVIGKPYGESDPYAKRFLGLAAAQPNTLRYEGPIHDRATLARVYREARGFVLLSTMESLSLSALEAAACECPLLLSDLPWARGTFGENASYCKVPASAARTAEVLRKFYDAAPTLKCPPRPLSWREVCQQLKSLYEELLKTSR